MDTTVKSQDTVDASTALIEDFDTARKGKAIAKLLAAALMENDKIAKNPSFQKLLAQENVQKRFKYPFSPN